MKIVIVIQARMSSTRLPGKVLKVIEGRPLLGYLLDRLRRVEGVTEVIVATSEESSDDPLRDFCEGEKVRCVRGPLEDVLARYRLAAEQTNADVIVRITGDCPLMDPEVVAKAIETFAEAGGRLDYVSNTLQRSYARGMDVEVFSAQALFKADLLARLPEEREHVTVFLYRSGQFRIAGFTDAMDRSQYRLTVDTIEDLELISRVIRSFLPNKNNFSYRDMVSLLDARPDLVELNAHVEQKKLSSPDSI